MTWLACLQSEHAQSAPTELVHGGAAHRSEPDDDDVVSRHEEYGPFWQVAAAGFLQRNELKLAAALGRADVALATAWYAVLVLRGVLPAVFAIAMGALVSAIQRGDALTPPLSAVGIVFV